MKNRSLHTIVGIIIVIAVIVITILGFRTYTNRSLFDVTQSFEQAMIRMPDGEIVKGRVQSWMDYEDGDQIQVRISDKTYLTHIANVVLISE